MAERRTLQAGLMATPTVDPAVAKAFIHEGSVATAAPAITTPQSPERIAPVMSRAPLSTRIRADFAAALKRASLERQLQGVEPNTLQDILEEAIEPWLRDHGHLT